MRRQNGTECDVCHSTAWQCSPVTKILISSIRITHVHTLEHYPPMAAWSRIDIRVIRILWSAPPLKFLMVALCAGIAPVEMRYAAGAVMCYRHLCGHASSSSASGEWRLAYKRLQPHVQRAVRAAAPPSSPAAARTIVTGGFPEDEPCDSDAALRAVPSVAVWTTSLLRSISPHATMLTDRPCERGDRGRGEGLGIWRAIPAARPRQRRRLGGCG